MPYLIGDLVERTSSRIDLRLTDYISLPVRQIDQFKSVDFKWNPSKSEFNRLRDIPEKQVKELFCKLLSDVDVPSDWGGEESDIFSSN